MVKLYFSESDYARDFEALIDVHEIFDWIPEWEYDLWLKAYDTSCRENDKEISLNEQGYEFDCYAFFRTFGEPNEETLYNEPARTLEEAEEVLIKMVDALASDKNVEAKIKQFIG